MNLIQPVLSQQNSILNSFQLSHDSSAQVNEAELFTHRLRNLIDLTHDTGDQLFKQYVDLQEQKKSENQQTMNKLIEWVEIQKKKQVLTMPALGTETQPKEQIAVKKEDQEKVTGEALDKLLYGDINPNLNLQEVLNVHKEVNQPKEKQQSEKNNAAQPDIEM